MATTWVQTTFRFRNDDGSESAASWIDAAGTNVTLTVDSGNKNFRIRIAAQQTGTTSAALTGRLYISKNGGTYAQASSSSTTGCKVVASANLTDDASTTQQLSSGTFVAGKVDDSTGQCSATGTMAQNRVTDHEYMLQLDYANLTDGDYFEFRERNSTTAFTTYTLTGRVTVTKSAPPAGTILPVGTQVSVYPGNNVTKSVTAGNKVLFFVADAAGSNPSSNPPVSSGSASTGSWNLVNYYDAGGNVSCMWWASVTGSGSLTVTFSYWNTDIGVSMHEYSGISDTSTVRQTNQDNGTSTNPSITLTSALNKSLIVGIFQNESGPYEAITPTSPFAVVTEQVSHTHSTLATVLTTDGNSSMAGTFASSKYWAGMVAEFIPAASSGAYSLTATTGTFTETGQNLTALKVARYLGASMQSYALAGQNLTAMKYGRYLGATMRAYTLTGQSLSALLAKRILGATTRTYTLTGQSLSALLAKRVLAATQQSYTLTRNNAGLIVARKLSATTQSYTATLENLTSLKVARRLSAAYQIYTLTGLSTILTYSGGGLHYYTLLAGVGNFTMTRNNAGLLASRVMSALSRSFTLTGIDAALRASRKLSVSPGNYSLTSPNAGLFIGRMLRPDFGGFTLTGINATLLKQSRLATSYGAFILTGFPVLILIPTPLFRTYFVSGELREFQITAENIIEIVYPESRELIIPKELRVLEVEK